MKKIPALKWQATCTITSATPTQNAFGNGFNLFSNCPSYIFTFSPTTDLSVTWLESRSVITVLSA